MGECHIRIILDMASRAREKYPPRGKVCPLSLSHSVHPLGYSFGCSARCLCCGLYQECVELGRSLAPHPRQDMTVGIQGQRDLRMPETLLDNLGMDALGQQQCRRSMSQVVEPDFRKTG